MKRIYILLFLLVVGAGFLSIAYASTNNSIPTSEPTFVTVQPGDTLWSISYKKYGDSVDTRKMVDKVVKLNGIKNGMVLQIGTELLLP